MSEDELDEYVDRALAALEAVSSAELEALSEQFRPKGQERHRKDAWSEFGHAFGSIALDRGSPPGLLERWAVRDALAAVDDDFLKAIENAEAPFWQVVREAVQVRRGAA